MSEASGSAAKGAAGRSRAPSRPHGWCGLAHKRWTHGYKRSTLLYTDTRAGSTLDNENAEIARRASVARTPLVEYGCASL